MKQNNYFNQSIQHQLTERMNGPKAETRGETERKPDEKSQGVRVYCILDTQFL